MTPDEELQVARLRARANALCQSAATTETRMKKRWSEAPSSFLTGGSNRRRSGLDKRWEKADAANRTAYQRVLALREQAARLEMRARGIEGAEAEAEQKARWRLRQKTENAARRAQLKTRPLKDRLFCGVFATGWSWCDTAVERDGDYRRLAHMSYARLELQFEKDCPETWKLLLAAEAAKLQAMRGQSYQVTTSGQTVTLGER